MQEFFCEVPRRIVPAPVGGSARSRMRPIAFLAAAAETAVR
jgi:hypothetical protein